MNAPAHATPVTYGMDFDAPLSGQSSAQQMQSYTTDLSKIANSSAPSGVTPLTPLPGIEYLSREECLQNYEVAHRDEGHIKNHYAYCQIFTNWKIEFYRIVNGARETQSRVTWRTIIVGYGNSDTFSPSNGRHVKFDVFIDSVNVTQFDPSAPRADDVTLTLNVSCKGDPQPASCSADRTGTPARMLRAWNNQQETFEFTSPESAGNPSSRELLAKGEFRIEMTLVPFPPYFEKPETRSSPPSSVRFDSANYIVVGGTRFPYGAVFDRVQPSILWARSGVNHTAVSNHIWTALNEPWKTKPYVANKHVPDVVHRLFWDDARRKANADQAAITCRINWPNYTEEGKQCDEYPFETTYEGAAVSQYLDRLSATTRLSPCRRATIAALAELCLAGMVETAFSMETNSG